MTIVTRRTLLVPYSESLQSDFLMLNCCAKNRAEMNGPHTVASAKQLFQRILNDPSIYAMAVLDIQTREYMGHVFISEIDSAPELGYLFDKTYWGKGLGTEAVKAFFSRACWELNLETVKATANTHHTASLSILNKLGFALVGEHEDTFGPFFEFVFTSDVEADENCQLESHT